MKKAPTKHRTIGDSQSEVRESVINIQGAVSRALSIMSRNDPRPDLSPAHDWLKNAAHVITHFCHVDLVDLQEAAHRLYVTEKTTRRKLGRLASASEMRRVYERTKGQTFVLDMVFPGMADHGPLFVWESLWWFAGAPQSEKGEKPTWKPTKTTWDRMPSATACTPGRCLMYPRDYVAKFRRLTRRSALAHKSAA